MVFVIAIFQTAASAGRRIAAAIARGRDLFLFLATVNLDFKICGYCFHVCGHCFNRAHGIFRTPFLAAAGLSSPPPFPPARRKFLIDGTAAFFTSAAVFSDSSPVFHSSPQLFTVRRISPARPQFFHGSLRVFIVRYFLPLPSWMKNYVARTHGILYALNYC